MEAPEGGSGGGADGRDGGRGRGGGPPIYRSATVHFQLPDDVARRMLAWGRAHIPDDWLFDPSTALLPRPTDAAATGNNNKKKKALHGAHKRNAAAAAAADASSGASDDGKQRKLALKKQSRGGSEPQDLYLPPCARVTAPHVTILGNLREVDFDAIRRDLQADDDQPDHFDLQFGRVAIWNSGFYEVVVVNVAATKAMNDLFRRLGRHPTQSTSDKARNNYKPHATIAYIRKDKVDALLHSLGRSASAVGGRSGADKNKNKNKKTKAKDKTKRGDEAEHEQVAELGQEQEDEGKRGEGEGEEEEGSGGEWWRKDGDPRRRGGLEFLLNETCRVDRFEFGWRDGTTTLIPRKQPTTT